jgi:hypothetical protein
MFLKYLKQTKGNKQSVRENRQQKPIRFNHQKIEFDGDLKKRI